MNQNIFNGLPKYVRLTVYVQARKLVSTAYFNYEDGEDIVQDLLLYYLEQFYKVPDVDEAWLYTRYGYILIKYIIGESTTKHI